MKYWKYYLVALLIIVIDQLSKWAVHTYMQPGMSGEVSVLGDWFKLHYTLNPGMAFGFELPPPYGKIVLTVFRLLAVTFIAYLIRKHSLQGAAPGLHGLAEPHRILTLEVVALVPVHLREHLLQVPGELLHLPLQVCSCYGRLSGAGPH